jgi:hypothetical protein
MPYLPIVIMLAFAVFFHRLAEFEDESGPVLTGLSILISAATVFYFHWSWLGVVLGQAGLFAGLVIVRLVRQRDL